MVGTQEFFFACLGLICAIVSWIKLRPSYAVWITGSWLLVTSATFLVSEPRYALTLFPIFMLAGLAGRNRFCYGTITTASLLFSPFSQGFSSEAGGLFDFGLHIADHASSKIAGAAKEPLVPSKYCSAPGAD